MLTFIRFQRILSTFIWILNLNTLKPVEIAKNFITIYRTAQRSLANMRLLS